MPFSELIFLCFQVEWISPKLKVRAGDLGSHGQHPARHPLGKTWLHRVYRNELTGWMWQRRVGFRKGTGISSAS